MNRPPQKPQEAGKAVAIIHILQVKKLPAEEVKSFAPGCEAQWLS